MKSMIRGVIATGGAALVFAGVCALAVQEPESGMPEPAPEHAQLMKRVGTWDCAMELWTAPGDSMQANGVEVNTALGQFHLLSQFEADMMGMPFEGHGVSSWDPHKKKFVTVWVDSVEPTPGVLEGTYDAESRVLTFTGQAMMMGEEMAVRQVVSMKDDDHRRFDMFVTPAGGEEMQTMRIDYTRRK